MKKPIIHLPPDMEQGELKMIQQLQKAKYVKPKEKRDCIIISHCAGDNDIGIKIAQAFALKHNCQIVEHLPNKIKVIPATEPVSFLYDLPKMEYSEKRFNTEDLLRKQCKQQMLTLEERNHLKAYAEQRRKQKQSKNKKS